MHVLEPRQPTIGISWFGAAASGVVGFTSIPNTIVSLASLAVFIIPLIALPLAYDAIVGEDEDGTLVLLLTYPLSKMQLLLGKLAGHGLILGIFTVRFRFCRTDHCNFCR